MSLIDLTNGLKQNRNQWWENEEILKAMVGDIPKSMVINKHHGSIVFEFEAGTVTLDHTQDCCESVYIDDVNGDENDIIGQEILVAEERVSRVTPENIPEDTYMDDSNTWSFYTFRTIKGSMDIRFHGSSNGYYSERVDVRFSPKQDENQEENLL